MIVEFVGPTSIILNLGDKSFRLSQLPGASGVKYSDGTTTFWTKGDEAFLMVDGTIWWTGLSFFGVVDGSGNNSPPGGIGFEE